MSHEQERPQSHPAEFIYDRGSAYLDKGELDQAITDFTKAIELDPTLAQDYYH